MLKGRFRRVQANFKTLRLKPFCEGEPGRFLYRLERDNPLGEAVSFRV